MTRELKLPHATEFCRLLMLWLLRVYHAERTKNDVDETLSGRLASLPDNATVGALHAAALQVACVDTHRACRAALQVEDSPNQAEWVVDGFLRVVAADGRTGAAIVDAWMAAGGDIKELRIPGINQRLVKRARRDGLVMNDYHSSCGTSHCIAGWYSHLADAGSAENMFSCELTAALVFAVNNPGEKLPYMGLSEQRGREELGRLERLNPVVKA